MRGRQMLGIPKWRAIGAKDLTPMRAVIADPDSSERDTLVHLCYSHGGLGNLIVAESGKDALNQIRTNRPDVALLACELEDMTGFDVLRALNDAERPATILVAPDERHAVEALSSAATDYLTRPVSAERLAMALKRACVSSRAIQDTSRSTASPPFGHCDRLVGERGGRIYFFSPMEIDYIEADSNYVKIHAGSERYINRDSLTRLSALLESVGFVRISRAVLLNLQRVSFAVREGRGVLAFVLESGDRVVSSTGFRLESGAHLRIARTRGTRRKSRIA